MIDGTTSVSTARSKPKPAPRPPTVSAPSVTRGEAAQQTLSLEEFQAAARLYREMASREKGAATAPPPVALPSAPRPTSTVPTGTPIAQSPINPTPTTFAPQPTTTPQPTATIDPNESLLASAPAAPTAEPAPEMTGIDPGTQLQDLTDAQLGSLLDLIAARYNLTREQLLADESQIGLQARALTEQLTQLRRDSVRAAQSGASERGLLRSGIHARQVAGIDTAIAGQASQGTAQAQTQLSQVGAAKSQIEAQIAAEQASARAASAAGTLQFQQGQTVQDLLAQLPLAPNAVPSPIMPANPYVPSPVLPTTPSNSSLFGASPGAGFPMDSAAFGMVDPAYSGGYPYPAPPAPVDPDKLTPEQIAAYLKTRTNQPRID